MDKVTISIATMPQRKEALTETLKSLLRQPVDYVHVYMNAFGNDWQPPLRDNRLYYWRSENEIGDLADSGKFYMADEINGFHLTCDDDLIYPPNYVERMVRAVEEYQRQAVISFHGSIICPPVKRYYRERRRTYPCLGHVPEDFFVNVAGTGTMGYHTDLLDVNVEYFERPFMADIWMAIVCQRQQVSQLVRAHSAGWIRSYPIDEATTIYSRFHQYDEEMAAAINSHANWRIFYALKTSASTT